MRIGMITGEFPPMQGGVGAFTDMLSREFITQGQKVSICTRQGAQGQVKSVPVHTPIQHWNWQSLQIIKQWSQNFDLINLQFQTAAYDMSAWVHFLPKVLEIPLVTTFHDLRYPYLFPKAGYLRQWIVDYLAKQSAGVIVTNSEDYEHVQKLQHVTMIPIGSNILIENKVDHALWRTKAGAKPDELLLAHFGFMNHSKGVDTLIQALALARASGIPARLVMIGGRLGASDPSNAAYAEHIDRLIKELGLADYITWTGYVVASEVSAYLQAADLVILPFRDGASYRRGSLMAAIHHHCAIITTTPIVPEPAFSEDNLCFVPPDYPQGIVTAIKALTPERRAELRTGTQAMEAYFAWDKIAADTLQFFQKVF